MSDDQNNSEATPAPSQSAAENTTPPPPPPPPPPSIDTQMSAMIKGSNSDLHSGEWILGVDTNTDE